MAQWIECQPVNQYPGSIPSHGTCLGCGPGPQLGEFERQPHIDAFLPPFPSLKVSKIFLKERLKLLYKLDPQENRDCLFYRPRRWGSLPRAKFQDTMAGAQSWDLRKQGGILGTSQEACCVLVLHAVMGEPQPPFPTSNFILMLRCHSV